MRILSCPCRHRTCSRALAVILTAALVMPSVSLRATGALETFDITAGAPSPIPGHILADVIGINGTCGRSRCGTA